MNVVLLLVTQSLNANRTYFLRLTNINAAYERIYLDNYMYVFQLQRR